MWLIFVNLEGKIAFMKMIKQITFFIAFAVLGGSAIAEWSEIEKFEDGMRVFVDKSTARRNGEQSQVKHLVRWGEPQIEEGVPPYLSTVVLTTYDCVDKREKYLGSVSYSGPMGNGPKVAADNNEEESWYSISDSSMEETLWKVACNLK